MKKIAFLLNKLECQDFTSGGEKVNFLMIKALSESGYEIDVYCTETDIAQSPYIQNIYINQQDLANSRIEQKYYNLSITENFRSADITYIHQNSRTFRDKIVRSMFQSTIKRIFRNKQVQAQKQEKIYEKDNLGHSKKLLVPSTFIKNDLISHLNMSPEKIEIISPPAKLNRIPDIKPPSSSFTFGLAARSFELKGGYDFLLAIALLKLFGKDAHAKIIVREQYISSTIKILKFIIKLLGFGKKIEFLDYNNDIEVFLASIDCLVMPSKREAFGLIAAEAMCLGLPVIVNNRCGISEHIKSGQNGFVYDFKPLNVINIYNLAKTMKTVLCSPDKLPMIRINAQKTSEAFSYEKFKAKINAVLNDYFS